MEDARPRAPDERDEGYVWYRGGGRWGGGRRFPWLGAFLVAIGAALVVDQADIGISTGHALALFAGLVFWAAYAAGWRAWAGLPAALLSGWGLARILQDLGYVAGSGWTLLFVGAAFLALYLAGLGRHPVRHGWALWVGLILVAVGAAEVALREIPGLAPPDVYIVPVLLIVAGAWLVLRAVRPGPSTRV